MIHPSRVFAVPAAPRVRRWDDPTRLLAPEGEWVEDSPALRRYVRAGDVTIQDAPPKKTTKRRKPAKTPEG